MRRALSETLVELLGAVPRETAAPDDDRAPLRITSFTMDLPIELAVRRTAGEDVVHADVPRWRWITGFDEQRGRLRLHVRLEEAT